MATTRTNHRHLGTVLSVWAHPDDETYLAGGLMASARADGARVVCVSATAGEHGTADPDQWPPDRLGRTRRLEATAAMAVLGVDEHEIGPFGDGTLVDHDVAGSAWVGALIDRVDPDTILTFGPDGMTYHPDHIAVHRWVTEAWRRRGRRARLLYAAATHDHLERFGALYEEFDVYMTDERPIGVPGERADVLVRLDGGDLDRKLVALRAMATQTSGVLAALDTDVYLAMIAEEAFVAARSDALRRPAATGQTHPDRGIPGAVKVKIPSAGS